MTDFLYENDAKVRKVAKRCFNESKLVYPLTSISEWKVIRYILCYKMVFGSLLTSQMLTDCRYKSYIVDESQKNRIFFEKLEKYNQDFLFFEQVMRESEKDPEFLSAWQTWFANVY